MLTINNAEYFIVVKMANHHTNDGDHVDYNQIEHDEKSSQKIVIH